MGTLFRNLRDHFLQCSLHHVPWGMRPGNPLPSHLIDQGCVIQAKFSGGAFRAGENPTNSFERAESECVRSPAE